MRAASKVATMNPQGCEYMTSRWCLSNAPVLESSGPGCHCLQLPLLLQCESCDLMFNLAQITFSHIRNSEDKLYL